MRYHLQHEGTEPASRGFRYRWMARAFLWVFCIGDREMYQRYSITERDK